jgi:hypothetical protein
MEGDSRLVNCLISDLIVYCCSIGVSLLYAMRSKASGLSQALGTMKHPKDSDKGMQGASIPIISSE